MTKQQIRAEILRIIACLEQVASTRETTADEMVMEFHQTVSAFPIPEREVKL